MNVEIVLAGFQFAACCDELTAGKPLVSLEAGTGIEPVYTDLQSAAIRCNHYIIRRKFP